MKTEVAPSAVLRAAPTVPPPASMVFASAKSERKVSGIAKARRLRSHNIPLPSELKASGSEEAPFCCLSLAAKQLCPCLEDEKTGRDHREITAEQKDSRKGDLKITRSCRDRTKYIVAS